MTNNRKSRKRRKQNPDILALVGLVAVAAIVCITVVLSKKTTYAKAITETQNVTTQNSSKAETESKATKAIAQATVASTEAATEAATKALPAVTKTQYATITVNVRKAPSLDSEVVGKLTENSSADVVEKVDDKWTKVIYGNEVCYIATEYLTDDKDWKEHLKTDNGYSNGSAIALDSNWKYAEFSAIHSGNAVMYLATSNRKNIVVGVNAGHGTAGGTSVKTWCHPDYTAKVTGGTTAEGATKAVAVSTGMTFTDGTPESKITLKEAQLLKDILLSRGYDVLMIRDSDDVQLDNVARTVICNNAADCHIAIHWDGDGLDYDKGCFYMSVPDGIKYLDSVAVTWQSSERLGDSLISGLKNNGCKIMSSGSMDMDLTQTSYSTVPSVDIELGNQSSNHSDETLATLAKGLADGVDAFFNN